MFRAKMRDTFYVHLSDQCHVIYPRERNYSRSRAVREMDEGPKTWQDAGGGGKE